MIIKYYAENTKDPTQCEGQPPDTLKYYAPCHFYDKWAHNQAGERLCYRSASSKPMFSRRIYEKETGRETKLGPFWAKLHV